MFQPPEENKLRRRCSHRIAAALLLALGLLAADASAQESADRPVPLVRNRFKTGDDTLLAFAPVAEALRHSIVKVDVNGGTVALAAVIDTNGLALTKSSEIKNGKLTCWLANGKEVDAELIAKDDDNDVALVKVNASGLKPISWAAQEPFVGQWTVTPGIESIPQAVGIVSVPPRKILHPRALIGVQFDTNALSTRIAILMPGYGAEKAGLHAGDVILAVNDASVTNRDDVIYRVRQFHEGQAVKLRVQRDEEQFEVNVSLKLERALFQFDRQDRMNRLGSELSTRAEGFELAIQHDTVLQSWQCGGPLVNLDGKAIGLNIARAGRVATYALPASLVIRLSEDLKAQAQQGVTAGETEKTSLQLEPALKQ
jgi:serine protease Do